MFKGVGGGTAKEAHSATGVGFGSKEQEEIHSPQQIFSPVRGGQEPELATWKRKTRANLVVTHSVGKIEQSGKRKKNMETKSKEDYDTGKVDRRRKIHAGEEYEKRNGKENGIIGSRMAGPAEQTSPLP